MLPRIRRSLVVTIASLLIATGCEDDPLTTFKPAGLVVSPLSGPTTEAGGTATFTVVLASEPKSGMVQINLRSNDATEGAVSPAGLTFTAANWNAPQTVTITGVDDSEDDSNQPYSIVFDLSASQDPTYGALRQANLLVINIDNDTAGYIVSAISGPTTEAGGTATFSVRLAAGPTADVTVNFDSNDMSEGTVDKTSLTFTTDNWNAPQNVIVTGVPDNEADGNQPYSIEFSATTSMDEPYAASMPGEVLVINVDDDIAGVMVSPTTGPTTESGGTATFTVVLASQPTADVTWGLSSSEPSEGTVQPTSLTFTAANWNAPQMVTVTGVDDELADGNQPYRVVFGAPTSTDATYAALTPAGVLVINIDNDTAGVMVAPISGPTTESGGAATFSIVLSSQPQASVSVNFASNDTSEGTLDRTSVAFTDVNWNAPQVVTVTGVDDSVSDGNQPYAVVFSQTTSADATYAAITPGNLLVINTDNDSAGILVSSISGPTTENGGSATFDIVLASEPTSNVSVNFASSDPAEGTVDRTSLTFTPVNWAAPQTVTVTGIDDEFADGNQPYSIQFSATTSGDSAYAAIRPANILVINTDNDTAGFVVSAVNGPTTESGGAATFDINLASQPTADVTVNYSSSDTTEGTVGGASLVFTPVNWAAPQRVTITGQDDDIVDGNQPYTIIFDATNSLDADYLQIRPPNVLVINIDDDSAGIIVSPISGPTTEGGGSATFTVRLTSEPTSMVTVNFDSSDATEGTVDVTSLVFTQLNWASPQTVTVTGVDDALADGSQPYTIVFTQTNTADSAYGVLTPPSLQLTNTDNDSAGILVSAISGPTTEQGATATFTVVLASQPSAVVTLDFVSSDPTEGTVSPMQLNFTSVNWAAPQTVTVTGVDDDLVDGNQRFDVSFGSTISSDAAYAAITPAAVSVFNIDDDSAGVRVIVGAQPTTEAGGQTTFSVVLTSEPAANVTFSFSSTDLTEGTISVGNLTFTPQDWNAPQVVTVTGVDDDVADGNTPFTIAFGATVSTDTDYAAITPQPVVIFNIDDETPGFVVTPVTSPTSERGDQAMFSVALQSEPMASVTLNFSSSDLTEGTLSVSNLSFTAVNWAMPQIVTITGVDDAVADGNQPYTIVFAPTASADPAYAAIRPANIAVFNLDDETPGIRVSAISAPTTEAGGVAFFGVSLASEPTGTVTVNFDSDDMTEGTLTVTSLSFTSANWNVVQTATVTGVDDSLADGNQPYRIVFAATASADLAYAAITPSSIVVYNIDDDTPGVMVSPISGPTSESGGAATFTVSLRSAPSASVTLTLQSTDATEGSVAPATMVFTSANWNVTQTATVTGVDDQLADGNQVYSVTLGPVTSGDAAYAALAITPVVVTNIDDDAAVVVVTPPTGPTSESGASATFSVVLSSEPTSAVTLNFTSNDETEGAPNVTSLSFTTVNWSTPQTVTVTGVDDLLPDGNVAYAIVFGATASIDPTYAALVPPSVPMLNLDDELDIQADPTSAILYYQPTGGVTFANEAAGALGVSISRVTNATAFNAAFDAGGFDMIIYEDGQGGMTTDTQARLRGWIGRGGRLVFSWWALTLSTSMQQALGLTVTSSYTAYRDVYRDPTLPVDFFALPIQRGNRPVWTELPSPLTGADLSGVNGVELQLASPGFIAARLDSVTGPGAIAVTRRGRVIVNGFLPADTVNVDNDNDGIEDMRELYENEILYLYSRNGPLMRATDVAIAAGSFTMGSPPTALGRGTDEDQHAVIIGRPFALSAYELNQATYQAVMGTNPTSYPACGGRCPIDNLTYDDAIQFTNALSMRDGFLPCYTGAPGNWAFAGLTCSGYRLPTESEWEYAARAGSQTALPNGDLTATGCTLDPRLDAIAWYCGNNRTQPSVVGRKLPNAWGLYDMSGNVWEWVYDWYGAYPTGPVTDPIGPAVGSMRVVRGCAFFNGGQFCTTSQRNSAAPNPGASVIGMRPARTLPTERFFETAAIPNQTFVPAPGTMLTAFVPDSDDGSLAVPIGFSFDYLGSTYSSIWVSTNGYLTFENNATALLTNSAIPTAAAPNALIAWWWDDLNPSVGGTTTTTVTGTAPNRVRHITFQNIPRWPADGSYSAEVRLFETSNVVEVHYGAVIVGANPPSASAGWEASIPQTFGGDVLGCSPNCGESNWPTSTILRFTP